MATEHVEPTRTYTVVTYMFPKRNPAYMAFALAVPNRKNPEALRQIFLRGWEIAKGQIDDWVERSGGWHAHHENKADKTVLPPIPDLNDDTSEKLPYKLYLRKNDTYIPILTYMVNLPHGHVRQKFVLLALVRGYEREGTAELVRPMLAQRG